MANNIFNPELGQVGSAVTPQGAVDRSGMVNVFAEVAQKATEATFAYTGQKELEGLKSKFDKLVKARNQGENSSVLQAKARGLLNEVKANSPWVADEADKLFNATLGDPTFEKTPQEKAQEAYAQERSQLALRLNITEAEAEKRIALAEDAKQTKLLADAQKETRQYNGEVVFGNVQTQLTNNSIQFMDAIKLGMTNNGGSLSIHDKRSLNLTAKKIANQLKAQLNNQVRDSNTGHLLVTKPEYDAALDQIDDWVGEISTMVEDQSYLKLVQEVNTEQSAEINVVATSKYRTIKEIEAAGGQAAVQIYLKASEKSESAAKQLLIGSNPVVADQFKQQGSFNQAAAQGIDKIMLPVITGNVNNLFQSPSRMSESEALATGTVLNDPSNTKLTQAVVEKASTEPQAEEAVKTMVIKNPDSSAIAWSKQYLAWRNANEGKAKRFEGTVLDGLKRSFLSTYTADNKTLPESFEFVTAPKPTNRLASSKQRAPKPNQIRGDGITKESGAILRNMLSIFTYNPKALDEVRSQSGVSDLTPQEAVPYVVLGNLPERASGAPEEAQVTTPVQSDQVVEKPSENAPQELSGEALDRFVSRVSELGWTEDDVTVFLNDMGFADNSQTELVKKKVLEGMKKKKGE